MGKSVVFKTVVNNGKYSIGDIGISVSEWYDLLLDKGTQQYIDVLLCFLRESEHTGSCTVVSAKYGNTAQYYNSKITNFCKWVQKKLNRFTIKGIDDKSSYWGIAMEKGWESAQGFQWQMRDELVKALQDYLMHELIQEYKTKEPFNGNDEEYKWALLDKVERKGVDGIITCLRGKNIVYNAQVDGILKNLWETKPKELTTCIENLLDETRPLIPRIEGFRDEMRAICPSEWNACANDERTASAILTCKYPTEYTFYKSEVYQTICRYFGFEYRSAFLKYEHFIEIISDFVADFGEEIQQIMLPQIGKYKNKPKNLAVQTLFWCMKEEMKAALQKSTSISKINSSTQETMQKNKYQEYIDLLKENKNLILTGAPGTGKTFMAKAIAEEMGAEIGFVQFHPSYDYTDFVEGLRPVSERGESIGFKLRNGIFKDFCQRALISKSIDKETMSELNDAPTVWKVSLMGTGDNPIRTDCFKNGYVRIGWYSYGDVEDFDDYQDFKDGGRNVLRAFQNVMKEGDIVVSCYSANDVDAVGVVTGGYEYREEGGEYPRYRTVKWLVKNICEDIVEMNGGKRFTLSAVYKASITAEDALNIVRKYNPSAFLDENVYQPFVFIIDEINRGEMSKIFGELFFSIDPGYRGEKGRVCTQYQNMIEEGDVFKKGFYVPENVYIIGTMNDIDRSVESMDFAMRRRFTWKEVTPKDTENMLDTLNCANEAKNTMNRLNKAIEETEGLGTAYMIGPAYFLKLGENGDNFAKLWNMNIEPLLKEYLRGFRKAKEILYKFKKAYFEKKNESGTDIPELIDED